MKQKITIGLSLALLLLAIFLIARDLFTSSRSMSGTACCDDDYTTLRKVDSSLVGYKKIMVIPTGQSSLTGLAVDGQGRIYACGNRKILVYNGDGKNSGEFAIDTIADCIAVNGDEIYVGMGAKIGNYNNSGVKRAVWKPYKSNTLITSIAVTENFVFAADAVNKRILKYSADGQLLQELGKKDSITGAEGFIIPSPYFDIARGDYNDLWAANTGRLRIENYTTNGNFRTSWGISSFDNSGFGGCCNPAHFALLRDGSFVTYEKGIDKIKLFDPAGSFICLVAGAGSFRGDTDFRLGNNNLVKDIATGVDGSVYVLDAYNQIDIFIKK